MSERALAGLRVLDLTTDFGYASKLFLDLGAEVTLVEPRGGNAARARPPLADGKSLWFAYRNAGKRSLALDLDVAADRSAFDRALDTADVVFDDRLQSYWQSRCLDWPTVHASRRELVWCSITPFGQTGPNSTARGCDLVAMASGGMAWLTGYEASGPFAADCGLAETSAAQYAAVMALIAVLGRDNVGAGQFVDVSMQEVVALGTETAPQFLAMKDVMRRRLGERARQAGIGVYPCADGHVFLYAAESGVGRGWNLLAQWIGEADIPGAHELRDPRWQDNAFKSQPEQRARFAELWDAFAARHRRQWLFEEGQRRRIAISPINEAIDVLADRHLRAAGFFDAQGTPGAPYRLSATPWHSPASPGAQHVAETSAGPASPSTRSRAPALPAAGVASLPLAGLRVVDLTWVGAGPFTTKLLADFGAEVWKIESPTRPDQLRRAEPLANAGGLDASGYFANRNTNKRSVTLDLKRPEDVERIRELVRHADIIANSFSPGVMDRVGLAWEEIRRINPRIVYLGMPFAGDEGPYRDYLGYGINIAALVGTFGRHARPDCLPVGTGTNFPDHLPNPLHACFAVLAALAWRLRSGQGQRITVSQVESTLAACPDGVLEAAATGRESPALAYVEPWRAPHGIYRCAGEDRWCAVSVDSDETRHRLAAVVDLGCGSTAHPTSDLLDARLREWLAARPVDDAVTALRAAGVAAAAVATPRDMLHGDAHLASRGFWQYLDHPVMGRCLYHGVAARFSLTSTRYRTGAPLLGQHNDALARLAHTVVLED